MGKRSILVGVLLVLPVVANAGDELDSLEQWAQWRGPLGNGVAPRGDPPVVWNEKKNVRWKTEIPGRGHSTPIVWGDRIFLTTAIAHGEALPPPKHEAPGAHHNVPPLRLHRFIVLAVDRGDGTILWKRTVREARPHGSTHQTASWASPSAVTDGKYVIASFGSAGLYGLDVGGELLWQTDPGDMRTKHGHGEGSSPALYGDTVFVNWDHEGESFLIALDKRTGEHRWKVTRNEGTSWSTPLVVRHGDGAQVIVAATHRVRAYDPADGSVIWECGGLSGNVVASPVAADGMVYVANSYDRRAILAIRLEGAEGDISGTDAVVWSRDRDTPYVPSPVLYDDTLCYLKHYQGLLTCVRAKTGKTLFGPRRLPDVSNVYASPVGAAERLYVVGLGGTTVVLERGPELQVLARNSLDDSFSASSALAGDEIYLRGERHLYCIAEIGTADTDEPRDESGR